jgi:hypothetical protein
MPIGANTALVHVHARDFHPSSGIGVSPFPWGAAPWSPAGGLAPEPHAPRGARHFGFRNATESASFASTPVDETRVSLFPL